MLYNSNGKPSNLKYQYMYFRMETIINALIRWIKQLNCFFYTFRNQIEIDRGQKIFGVIWKLLNIQLRNIFAILIASFIRIENFDCTFFCIHHDNTTICRDVSSRFIQQFYNIREFTFIFSRLLHYIYIIDGHRGVGGWLSPPPKI